MKISRRIFVTLLTLVLLIGCTGVIAFADTPLLHGIGFVKVNGLRLRQEPNTTSAILATADYNDCVVVIAQDGDWYKVNYNLTEGYMYKDYLSVLTAENAELGYGKVTGSAVNLRTGPSTGYSIVATASKGEKCYIIGLNQGWFKVIYGSNVCYIRSDFLELTELPYENKASANSPKFFRTGKSIGPTPSASALNGTAVNKPSAIVTGSMILSTAQMYLGTPYAWGGASPAGFDCSGFVYYVLKSLGYDVPRTPADQIRLGYNVSKGELQPGDIVFFANTGASGISHVGIYAGNGRFIHAPNSRSVVSYSDLTTGYWAEHYYTAHRVV